MLFVGSTQLLRSCLSRSFSFRFKSLNLRKEVSEYFLSEFPLESDELKLYKLRHRKVTSVLEKSSNPKAFGGRLSHALAAYSIFSVIGKKSA